MGVSSGLRAARRHKVGVLWLKGFSYREIQGLIQKDKSLHKADLTTLNTVAKDVNAIKKDLKERIIRDIESLRALSIESLRLVKARAWTEISSSMTLPGTRSSLLAVISTCEERIAKLEGTFAPVELNQKVSGGVAVNVISAVPRPDEEGDGHHDNGDRLEETLSTYQPTD